MSTVRVRSPIAMLVGAIGLGFLPSSIAAQGCEPIRFTVPISLGGEGEAYQPGREWRLTLGYRRLHSNQWFIGTEQSPSLAPGGRSPVFKIHTFVGDVAYSFNDRVRARVSIPFSTGSFSRFADGAFREQSASGIGDVTVQGEVWLLRPRTHQRGNISIGFGIKAPTGSHSKPSQFYMASGPVDFPADQTIQPGDGGWALSMQVMGFQRVTDRGALYAFGSYMASPKAHSDIALAPSGPNSTVYWSVPDVYSARAGAVFDLLPDEGLSVSLGVRVDGIPVRDLIGGGDENTIKRTSRIIFADPGLSFTRGKNSFTLSVPWRMKVNRMKSLREQQTGGGVNGGGFAKYLVFASYSRRL